MLSLIIRVYHPASSVGELGRLRSAAIIPRGPTPYPNTVGGDFVERSRAGVRRSSRRSTGAPDNEDRNYRPEEGVGLWHSTSISFGGGQRSDHSWAGLFRGGGRRRDVLGAPPAPHRRTCRPSSGPQSRALPTLTFRSTRTPHPYVSLTSVQGRECSAVQTLIAPGTFASARCWRRNDFLHIG